MSEEMKMSRAETFKKWRSERTGHPLPVLLASEAISELESEIETLTEQTRQLREGLAKQLDVLKGYGELMIHPLSLSDDIKALEQLLEQTK